MFSIKSAINAEEFSNTEIEVSHLANKLTNKKTLSSTDEMEDTKRNTYWGGETA